MAEKKFKIFADTTVDLTLQWFRDNDVDYVKHGLVVEGKEVVDEFEKHIPTKDVIRRLRDGETLTTLQGKLEDYNRLFEDLSADGSPVVYIAFSSALSGSYGTAVTAANMMMQEHPERELYCFDTCAATMGQGLLVMKAVELRDQDLTIKEAMETLESLKENCCHFFTVDDLNHLYRGGRLSKTSAIMGTIMGIKPTLYISDEGKLTPIGKVRGRKAAISDLVKYTKEYIDKPEEQTVYITHGDCEEDAKTLVEALKKEVPCKDVDYRQLSPVISIHSGPGTLAIFFWGRKRLDV